MERMGYADAVSYWLSAKIPNDQFLVYCFADPGISLDECATVLLRCARGVLDLCLRVEEIPGSLDHPYWVAARPEPDQVVVHEDVETWRGFLDALGAGMADQLVATRAAWRLHLFGPIDDPPLGGAGAVIVVLQVVHALGDGRRTSRIARELFTGTTQDVHGGRPLPAVLCDGVGVASGLVRMPWQIGEMLARGVHAYRLQRAADAGRGSGYAPGRLNTGPDDRRSLRVVVTDHDTLTGNGAVSVTVAALTAISVALAYSTSENDGPLGVELTVGRTEESGLRNNFRNAGLDLHLEEPDLAARAALIADGIRAAQAADSTPARRASRRATEATPAILTHWATRQFDPDVTPERLTGNTVCSSVNRGPADFSLGSGAVQFSCGFPALSPVQGLTHGVHGLGDRIAISVTTSPAVLPDVDHYLTRLRAAVETVAIALRANANR